MIEFPNLGASPTQKLIKSKLKFEELFVPPLQSPILQLTHCDVEGLMVFLVEFHSSPLHFLANRFILNNSVAICHRLHGS
jgi:hypothetical protein